MNIFDVTDKFKMYCGNDMERYRCESFRDKEPETLNWIEGFEDGKVFFDIGANVGIYSLYAASLFPNMKIYAFEPMPTNFSRLLQNVELNGFDNIYCFNIALSDKELAIKNLHIPNSEVGQSGSQLYTAKDEYNRMFRPEKTIQVLQLCYDVFINIDVELRKYPVTYIKIDVDGHEKEILKGMDWHFTYTRNIQSVLVECNKEKIDVNRLIENMGEKGLVLDNKLNHLPNHSRNRRGNNPENVIFTRNN